MECIGEYSLTSDEGEEEEVADQPEPAKDQVPIEDDSRSMYKAGSDSEPMGTSQAASVEGQPTIASSSSTAVHRKHVSSDHGRDQRVCHNELRSSVGSGHHRHHHHHSKRHDSHGGKGGSSRRRSRSSSSSSSRGRHRRRSREYDDEYCSYSRSKPRKGRPHRSLRERFNGHRPERATVNAEDLMQQVQERKRLWQSNKDKKISSQWQQLISSCESGQTANKFRKLMGLKDDATVDSGPTGAQKQEHDQSSRVMENLDRQYAEARILTHTCRGMGLGYGSGH